ncbi:hypothetical protein Slin15195_G040210 [Septoria linicola]|uniref:Uncharacterized protein n=1 Tax=Septoria linicola TaxID=215465 RepID=A0A9Q9EI67_9PEZI|nr:hypothetical protein Slin15195_G040210 [Septoria linicola]
MSAPKCVKNTARNNWTIAYLKAQLQGVPVLLSAIQSPGSTMQVTCKTWVTALRTVLQAGISAIPGIGGAIGSGVVLAMQAAETAAYTFERPDDIVTGFQAWIEAPSSAASDPSTWALDKACGNKYTPPEAQQIFGAFNMASAGVGANSSLELPEPGLPRFRKVVDPSTICSAIWGTLAADLKSKKQIHMRGRQREKRPCVLYTYMEQPAPQGLARIPRRRIYLCWKARQKQRKAMQCEADEWPPAYFIPRGKEREKEWAQRIRSIPSGENGGAGNLWQGFCAQHDGGKYNNQRVRISDFDDNTEEILEDETEFLKEKLNEKLLAPLGKPNTKIGDKTDTHSYATVTYTRAVFELEFNWGDMEVPSAQNNWYLDENPCWPRYIAGDDPGFVLLADDPWYDGHPDLKKRVDRWAKPPTDTEKADAAKAKAADESSDDSDGPPPAKAPKLNPPAADSRKFKRLDLVDGRLVLRDEISNATRPLTADEIRHNVEVSDCADRHCSRERRNGEDSLFLPGSGPPPTPSVNVAVPTMITSVLLQARAEPASLTPAVAQVTAPSRPVV